MDAELAEAIALYRQQGPEVALPELERLQAVFQTGDDLANHALATRYVGECHWRMGNFEDSRHHLEAALKMMRELGDRLNEGKVLNVLGLLEWDMANYQAAIDTFASASAIGEEIGDSRLAGSTLNNLSLVYDELGDYSTSI